MDPHQFCCRFGSRCFLDADTDALQNCGVTLNFVIIPYEEFAVIDPPPHQHRQLGFCSHPNFNFNFLNNYYQCPCIFSVFLSSIFSSWIRIKEMESWSGSTALVLVYAYILSFGSVPDAAYRGGGGLSMIVSPPPSSRKQKEEVRQTERMPKSKYV